MRAAPSAVAFRLIVGLSAAGVAATLGCSGRPGSDVVVASAAASAAPAEQERREKGEEASCCARHFPGNRRLREACLSDAAHHHGVCAPRCPPPHDAGSAPDAAFTDASVPVDAAGTDARVPVDAAGTDARVGRDGSPTEGGVADASTADGSGPPTCPTTISLGRTSEQIGVYSGWKWTAALDPGQAATWKALPPTSSFSAAFTLLETAGPVAEVECRGAGDVLVDLTVVGPGACTLTSTLFGSCLATCGNGIVEKGEQCDPPDGVLCNDQCQQPLCGDGVIEPGEDCDRASSLFCQNCRFNSCYGCVAGAAHTQLCSTTTGSQKIACQVLEECIFGSLCPLDPVTYRCFCATADCSAGATGACGQPLEEYLGTTRSGADQRCHQFAGHHSADERCSARVSLSRAVRRGVPGTMTGGRVRRR